MWKGSHACKMIEAVVLLAVSCWIADAMAATNASPALGQLTVDGKTITLRNAYAVAGPDTFDGTKQAYLVLLTEKPLPPDAIKGAESFDVLGEKSVRSLLLNGLALQIGPDKGYHLTIRHPALNDRELQKSSFQGLRIESLGPDKVAGTIASSSGMGKSEGDGGSEEITPNHRAQFKIRFDTPVERRFPLEEKLELGANATKLPAGGGEPGKAWMDQECKAPPALPNLKDTKAVEKYLFAQGMTEKDLQEQIAQMSKREGRKVTREEALKSMAEMIAGMADLGNAMSLKDCKVLSGAHDGKIAILQVEATMGGGRARTDVTLVKQGSAWTVKKTGAWRSPD
jgi:hypothetical protein